MARKNKTGRLLGLPYDRRKPTPERFKKGIWNPEERRLFVSKVYGWGYGINLWEVARRLRLVRRSPPRG
ncbi:MAG: hypothetical protein JOZ19_02075 [Rubrobacter sp.]|nr:hypothetical protein [Rubrobacter sp.]